MGGYFMGGVLITPRGYTGEVAPKDVSPVDWKFFVRGGECPVYPVASANKLRGRFRDWDAIAPTWLPWDRGCKRRREWSLTYGRYANPGHFLREFKLTPEVARILCARGVSFELDRRARRRFIHDNYAMTTTNTSTSLQSCADVCTQDMQHYRVVPNKKKLQHTQSQCACGNRDRLSPHLQRRISLVQILRRREYLRADRCVRRLVEMRDGGASDHMHARCQMKAEKLCR